MRANILPNGCKGRDGAPARPGPGETGTQVFCNVGPVSDSDETVCARGPKCLRWALTALLLTAINTAQRTLG